MDIQEKNREMLIRHFEEGGKRHCTDKVGVELEHIIVDKKSRESISYYGERGVGALLERIADHFPWRYEPEGSLLGVYNDDYSITLEPAGQLEVSINPRESISPLYRIYRMFVRQIRPILEEWGYDMITLGYHPVSKVDDIRLIPKKRYEYMDRYFRTSGTCGKNMMRGTASTQVSVDYSDEKDFVEKIRLAYLLMPLLKLLTDNTPILEGSRYEGCMARSYIWENVDPKRTGIIPGLFDADFGFESYARFLMNLPVIFIPGEANPIYTDRQTVSQIWENTLFTNEDLEHILSMNFQDVRLKHYLEIRYADSMPISCVLGYAALLKGIFYSADARVQLREKLPYKEAEILQTQRDLMKRGFRGRAYGYSVEQLLWEVTETAKKGLSQTEQLLLIPLEEVIDRKNTLAGEYR